MSSYHTRASVAGGGSRNISRPVLLPLIAITAALGFLATVASFVSVYAAAVPFVIGFGALVYTRPDLAFILIIGSCPFCYDLGLGPVKIAFSDISMLLALPILLVRAKDPFGRFLQSPILLPAAAYLLVCSVSILASGDASDAITSMVQMILYLIIAPFFFSSCVEDARLLFIGIYGMLGSGVFLAIAKLCSSSLFVLGLHKNSIGSSLSYAVVMATEIWFRSHGKIQRYMMIVLVILMAGLLSSLSRGAWLGAMGGVLVILLLRARFTLFARVIGIGIPVVVACWFMLPAQAQDYASDFSVTANNIRARFDSLNLAYGYFQSNPLLGVGVGLRKEYDATNLVMSTLAETGVTGLLAFTSIYVCFAFAIWRSRSRLGVNDRSFSLLAIGSALAMCQLLHGMVDHFWSRGCLPAWAGMGFVVWASQNTTIPARRGRA